MFARGGGAGRRGTWQGPIYRGICNFGAWQRRGTRRGAAGARRKAWLFARLIPESPDRNAQPPCAPALVSAVRPEIPRCPDTSTRLTAIEPASASAQEPFHTLNQVGLGRLDDQVKVVARQTPRMHLPAGLGAALAQSLEEEIPVLGAAKYRLLVTAAVHDVTDRPFGLPSQFACHGQEHCGAAGNCHARSLRY